MKSIGVERELEWCRMRRKQQIATNGLKPANVCQCNTILGPPRNSPARFSYCNNAGKTRRNLSQRGSATSDWALSASIVTRAESLAGGRWGTEGDEGTACVRVCPAHTQRECSSVRIHGSSESASTWYAHSDPSNCCSESQRPEFQGKLPPWRHGTLNSGKKKRIKEKRKKHAHTHTLLLG